MIKLLSLAIVGLSSGMESAGFLVGRNKTQCPILSAYQSPVRKEQIVPENKETC